MVLPTGINKASGLRAAVLELGLSPHNAVGVGDAENDEAFLRLCDASAAVDNALETVKKQVDVVLSGAGSVGVVELIKQLIADDLHAALHDRPDRTILLGSKSTAEMCGTRCMALVCLSRANPLAASRNWLSACSRWIEREYRRPWLSILEGD